MSENDFYPPSVLEKPILDRSKYRGKGRPRKIDYMSLIMAQQKINQAFSNAIDRGFRHAKI